ncbi:MULTISPECIES: hypothetical protein [Stenotrophomonas]|uniref:Secreted protein n=1 Tax=Stenotrophomonas nitritireducens TaxID=83617 RepID=A0ABR5NJZ1_9GAMM|nr:MULTISPECIES: hypothetical protein [Stenotrophomonas]KQO02392.1 hypothetical protein ASF01_01300 [Stenotrophomonas sp. Leaf70]KRG57436.1 hypothetical protein ABB22_09405 [Stenotrophomonas nitritireducens]MBN8769715.1 hypothetical protein [Stenotrophomonas sp.]MBN8792260.1 hypothetical protein [Stenotrophomonas nitritireducens]
MAGRNPYLFPILIGCLLAMGASGTAQASGARQGVKAQPGEIVLLRDVPTRPAYRMQPPGMALIVDPSPRRELAAALGTGGGIDELDEDGYASIDSATDRPSSAHAGGTTVERVTGSMVGTTLGHAMGEGGMLSGSQLARTIGGPMGAVGGATRGIGDQVRGALAQFPMGQTAGPGGR